MSFDWSNSLLQLHYLNISMILLFPNPRYFYSCSFHLNFDCYTIFLLLTHFNLFMVLDLRTYNFHYRFLISLPLRLYSKNRNFVFFYLILIHLFFQLLFLTNFLNSLVIFYLCVLKMFHLEYLLYLIK